MVAVLAAWYISQGLLPGARIWWAYKQCEELVMSPERIVFDATPLAVTTLNDSDPEAALWAFNQLSLRIGSMPKHVGLRAAVHVPKAWAQLDLPRRGGGLVFAHGRRTPSGHQFLVDVQPADVGELALISRLIVPATLISRPRVLSEHVLRVRAYDVDRLQLVAGQPDPKDESRFTIAFSFAGESGTIEGRLTDTGRVVLTPSMGIVERGTSGSDVWLVER